MQSRLRVGSLVDGRFRLLRRLGGGGTADVFRARDLRAKRDVAVKIQLPRTFENTAWFASDGRSITADFENLQALACVEGVTRAFHLGSHEGRQYAAYELIPGSTLHDFVQEYRPLDARYVACIIDQLAAILGDVHDSSYVHRDVKPDNVMIQPNGRIRLLDLGSALPLEGEIDEDFPIGTSGYSAPEQYDFEIARSPQLDIYALGCVLFEISVMQLPYSDYIGRPESGVEPFPQRGLLAELPRGLRLLGSEMIALDPAARPATMADVRERLHSLDLIPAPGTAADPKAPQPDPTMPYRLL